MRHVATAPHAKLHQMRSADRAADGSAEAVRAPELPYRPMPRLRLRELVCPARGVAAASVGGDLSCARSQRARPGTVAIRPACLPSSDAGASRPCVRTRCIARSGAACRSTCPGPIGSPAARSPSARGGGNPGPRNGPRTNAARCGAGRASPRARARGFAASRAAGRREDRGGRSASGNFTAAGRQMQSTAHRRRTLGKPQWKVLSSRQRLGVPISATCLLPRHLVI
jgi:hypothetical protein